MKGYLKLIDLGTAKILKPENGIYRTFTLLGTPHYMAPEIISGKGYTFSVDVWSVGICLYEFVCGYLPYGEDIEDPFLIYEKIMKTKLNYPAYFKDKKTRAMIEQLLSLTPELRTGGSFAALKANQWFDNLDWVTSFNFCLFFKIKILG